jgi:hypothetical protein
MAFEISELLSSMMDQLPADRQKAVNGLVDEYGATDSGKLVLALVAGATARERRLVRMLLGELDRLES